MSAPRLVAVSDLHVAYAENRSVVERLRPDGDEWLVVAGDVAERFDDVVRALRLLAGRFARVVWTPGNHELWSHPSDPVTVRGRARYDALVAECRELGVLTPEDPYEVWPGGVVIAPLFVLYDYTFRMPGLATKEQSLAAAHAAGVVCADERFLHPDPHASIEDWCDERVAYTAGRLDACDPALPTVLINHWPLVRTPTEVLRYPEFAQWCGTERTADWHRRYRARAVVYGHLHIPRVTWEDGVRMEEVSLGYPREWTKQDPDRPLLRQILPEPT